MMRIVIALAYATLLAANAHARQPDNPCPTCCAQLKAQQKTMKLDKPLADEVAQATTASVPGDPMAEIHCYFLVQKLKQQGKMK